MDAPLPRGNRGAGIEARAQPGKAFLRLAVFDESPAAKHPGASSVVRKDLLGREVKKRLRLLQAERHLAAQPTNVRRSHERPGFA